MIWDFYKTVWCSDYAHSGLGWFNSDKKDINEAYQELIKKEFIYRRDGCSCRVEVREKQ